MLAASISRMLVITGRVEVASELLVDPKKRARSSSGPSRLQRVLLALLANEDRDATGFLVEVRPTRDGEANALVEAVRHPNFCPSHLTGADLR